MDRKCMTEKPEFCQETIMVVEDEPAILAMARTMLERLGYKVLTASTPEMAIDIASNHKGKIDLLITDVIMPEMNGRDLAAQILLRHPDIRLLFMSGYTADIIADHEVSNESLNFIQKPFSMKNINLKVREVLSKSKYKVNGHLLSDSQHP